MVQSESAQWLQENVGGPLHEGIQKAIQASNPKYPARTFYNYFIIIIRLIINFIKSFASSKRQPGTVQTKSFDEFDLIWYHSVRCNLNFKKL